jgi:hypothetical protein
LSDHQDSAVSAAANPAARLADKSAHRRLPADIPGPVETAQAPQSETPDAAAHSGNLAVDPADLAE